MVIKIISIQMAHRNLMPVIYQMMLQTCNYYKMKALTVLIELDVKESEPEPLLTYYLP